MCPLVCLLQRQVCLVTETGLVNALPACIIVMTDMHDMHWNAQAAF